MTEYFIYAVLAAIFMICPCIAIYNLKRSEGYIASLHRNRRNVFKK